MEEKEEEQAAIRDCACLYCHRDTLACSLSCNCTACLYKIFPAGTTDLGGLPLPRNVRPESCQRDYRNKAFKDPRQLHSDSISAFSSSTSSASSSASSASSSQDPLSLPWYTNKTILTIGDGDFSFSLSLAKYHAPRRVVATSYESHDTVVTTYTNSGKILDELQCLGKSQTTSLNMRCGDSKESSYRSAATVKVLHNIDAKSLTKCEELQSYVNCFDYIIWNFPCVRDTQGADAQTADMDENKEMLRVFFREALPFLKCSTPSAIHITHKTIEPFCWWGITNIAEENGLYFYSGSLLFDRCLFPGYINRKALDKRSFSLHDAQVFEYIAIGDRANFKAVYKNPEPASGSIFRCFPEILLNLKFRGVVQRIEYESSLLQSPKGKLSDDNSPAELKGSQVFNSDCASQPCIGKNSKKRKHNCNTASPDETETEIKTSHQNDK